ncbi:MAG TPA: DNA polymerase [Mycobacterium sp.]|jgi:P4 family phage/plasmid primase-like protien|uniref:DNA polymerase n=1 Tax=Mycobacterium sp. TaxID=1785 RepID=UPI002F417A50
MNLRPFADAVATYALAGWPVVPVPPETKTPPPAGYTGASGVDADPEQLVRWAGSHADSSIAVRMPEGVIGIDVDEYVKGSVTKHGAATVNDAWQRWGPLPATWSSTARGSDTGPGPSQIMFYRVPVDRYATVLGPDVEIIQRHHRYAVVWPSVHVGAGAIYRWYDPQGLACEPPKPTELPELPQAWVDGLREGAAGASDLAAPQSAGEAMWSAIFYDDRPACAQMASALLDAQRLIEASTSGTRHDAADDRAWNLIQLSADGHPGLGAAFAELSALWEQITAGEDRGEEWLRMFVTAARKAVTRLARTTPVDRDPCFEAMGLTLVPAPAPGTVPGADPAEPIAPPRPWSTREIIGAQLFDPPFHLDHPLGQCVLERMYPVMRYAYDSHGWLRRGPEYWEDLTDLSEWAVTEVAGLMPHGDPDAEKGSEAFIQAARRRRFMSGGPSGAIARKMRALLAGGTHPCSVAAAELDRDPWLLWAGGIAWDLRASYAQPTPALIDPATPHLRAAAVAPVALPTPLWDAFTAAVWPDPELRAWALRVLSVAVTGDAAKVLPILVGEGDRGKTQVIVLIMSVLGSYAHAADPRLLGGTDRSHASIVTALKGRRLSFIDEAPRDSSASQERLKQLTGGGELTGNDMGRNPITFTPTHTLVLTANEPPLLTDPAVRRRVRLVPCEGDPVEVIAARRAIGSPAGAAWRAEAPGVLAALMREAAGWLADETTARTESAPERYRYRAEEIAAEQNTVRAWIEAACEPDDAGTPSHELRRAFVDWARDMGMRDGITPTMTKWGMELGKLGYPVVKRRAGHYRALRIRSLGSWLSGAGVVQGTDTTPAPSETPVNTGENSPPVQGVQGVQGSNHLSAYAHARTHIHEPQTDNQPPTPCTPCTIPANTGDAAGSTPAPAPSTPCTPVGEANPGEPAPAKPEPARPAVSALTQLLLANKAEAHRLDDEKAAAAAAAAAPVPAKPKRVKVDPAVRAAEKAAAKAQALADAIAEAGGEILTMPAVVTRDGAVRPIALGAVAELVDAFGMLAELTVDVEHTGYPIGHPDYALRTIQIGNEHVVAVFDAGDQDQLAAACGLIEAAAMLHAFSATADLIPVAIASSLDLDSLWDRMHDTVIPAKLTDPRSARSDASGLKEIAEAVLGLGAVSTAAEEARSALFKAGKWLTETKPTTPLERSGWAQVDSRCTTMVRYAASDVLDTAALHKTFPAIPSAVLERERTAQRMTARVAHEGMRIDGEHVAELIPVHTAARAAAGELVRKAGIDNPGSDPQVGAALAALGAELPRTRTGRLSVAKGVLDPFKNADGAVGDLVRNVLQYRHHDTVLGTFLEPYRVLVERGDGRARPTIYTLGADTGRMSCVRPNLQQMPRQGGIRACITADPGSLLVSADFASVEIRVAAALSGDQNLQQMLAAGVDLHWEIARQVYGPEASKEDRYNVKRGVFGRLYGSGIPGIARTLGISESEAASMVDTLDAMTPQLTAWSRSVSDAVKSGHTQFPSYAGRVIHLPKMRPHAAPNYCIQGTARELLVDTLMRWRETRWADAVLLPVHDEIVAVIDESEAADATAALVASMETTLAGVPIKAEASEPSYAWKDAS